MHTFIVYLKINLARHLLFLFAKSGKPTSFNFSSYPQTEEKGKLCGNPAAFGPIIKLLNLPYSTNFWGEKAYILNTIGHQYQGSAFPETETKLIGSSCVQILGGGDVQEKPDKNHVLLGELCVTPSRDCQ